MTVAVEVRNVAGVQPSIGIDGLGRRLGVVQIPLHDLRPTYPQLTIGVDITIVAFEVDDAALGVRDGDSRRAGTFSPMIVACETGESSVMPYP